MNKTIWKYEMGITVKQKLEMPVNAEILTVQIQEGKPCLWALVDPNEKKEIRTFETFGTGSPIYCDMEIDRKYIGTCQLYDGSLILHIFETLKP